ncbi:MAG: cell division protein FtsA [candidate division Zixibacteria bacterium]|nr:cell division protein FtsA [candidate division Zixibacteria bacterium]
MTAAFSTITGLDIGTSQVTAITAEVDPDGTCKIVGVGQAPSPGLRRGVIVHLDRTSEAIRRALADAELMAGVPPGSIHANIAGDHIRSVNSRGVVAVSKRGGIIGEEDVDRVMQAARAVPVPPDREVIHVLPREFIVDDQGGIKDPIGMVGSRLEVEVHIVTAAALAVNNIHHCTQQAGYTLDSLTLSILATADAVLSEREREMGVALVDVGAGLTDVAVFLDDAVRHTATIALGGRNVTNDLAIGLRTTIDSAEQIKLTAGAALSESINAPETVSVPGVGDQPPREVSQRVIASIIGPRLEELFLLAKAEIQKAPITDMLASGVVLAGGGGAISGAAELAERIFDLPVRIGRPSDTLGLMGLATGAANATAVGLITRASAGSAAAPVPQGVFRRLTARIGNVLSEFL